MKDIVGCVLRTIHWCMECTLRLLRASAVNCETFTVTPMMRLITPENERSSSVTDAGKSFHRKGAEVAELLQNNHPLRSPRLCGEFS